MRVATGLLLVTVWGTGTAAAQLVPSRWRVEERVVVGDFSEVLTVGAGSDVVFAVTPGGIGQYDTRFRRWGLPAQVPATLLPPLGAPALVDPVDRSLWFGGLSGVLHYDPRLESMEVVSVPGGVVDLMFDRNDTFSGLYVRSSTGWYLVARGSGFLTQATTLPPPTQQIRPPRVAELELRLPGLTARSLALTDPRMRSYQFTAAGEIPETGDVFVGTDGLGLLELDPVTQELRPLPFGLLSADAWAVVRTADGVVVGSGARGLRRGITWVSADLQRYRQEEGPPATGYRFGTVLGLAVDGEEIWAATDRGLWRVAPDGNALREAPQLVGDADVVYAVAVGPGGAWVGTERGLFVVERDGETRWVDERVREPVLAILPFRDTVWVGVAGGLGFVSPGGSDLLVPGEVADEPWLREAVVALAVTGQALAAATEARVAWRDSTGRWTVERAVDGEIGRIVAMVGDAAGLWILGATGLARFRPGAAGFQFPVRRDDLPGNPRGLTADDRYLWIATDGGLVRFERGVLGP